MNETLIQFDGRHVVTVHRSGIVDVRLVNDVEHTTLTGRMRLNEFVSIVGAVFGHVADDPSLQDSEMAAVQEILLGVDGFEQAWR